LLPPSRLAASADSYGSFSSYTAPISSSVVRRAIADAYWRFEDTVPAAYYRRENVYADHSGQSNHLDFDENRGGQVRDADEHCACLSHCMEKVCAHDASRNEVLRTVRLFFLGHH
jgi:hypothetical protein